MSARQEVRSSEEWNRARGDVAQSGWDSVGSNHSAGARAGGECSFPWEKAGEQRVWKVLAMKLLCAYSPFMHSPLNGARI